MSESCIHGATLAPLPMDGVTAPAPAHRGSELPRSLKPSPLPAIVFRYTSASLSLAEVFTQNGRRARRMGMLWACYGRAMGVPTPPRHAAIGHCRGVDLSDRGARQRRGAAVEDRPGQCIKCMTQHRVHCSGRTGPAVSARRGGCTQQKACSMLSSSLSRDQSAAGRGG